jgi:hypothetical protein
VSRYAFTPYFENEVLRKRSYLMREWCIQVIANPVRVQFQSPNRFRFWAPVPGCTLTGELTAGKPEGGV